MVSQTREDITSCTGCGLSSAVPSSRIDESGRCAYCRKFKGCAGLEEKRTEYRAGFEKLIAGLRSDGAKSPYDILVAYSGGKDSSYTLDILTNEFGLRVLALTFDHGFVSPHAFDNIRRVVEALGVDHILFKPSFSLIAKVFRYSLENEFHPPKALERASSICNSCMGIVKSVILKTAIEKHIPLIAYGWSPGQAPMQSAILKNQPQFIQKAQELFLNPLRDALGPEIQAYFLEESHFQAERFPANVNPLAFLDYDEKTIYRRIGELGWTAPDDTDPNSTNCLLNGFANLVHLRKHRYHPYAMELAGLVREGVLSREEASNRLSEEPDPRIAKNVMKSLGIASPEACGLGADAVL